MFLEPTASVVSADPNISSETLLYILNSETELHLAGCSASWLSLAVALELLILFKMPTLMSSYFSSMSISWLSASFSSSNISRKPSFSSLLLMLGFSVTSILFFIKMLKLVALSPSSSSSIYSSSSSWAQLASRTSMILTRN